KCKDAVFPQLSEFLFRRPIVFREESLHRKFPAVIECFANSAANAISKTLTSQPNYRETNQHNLSLTSFAEQDVVIRVGIERQVEINEVNAGVGRFFDVGSQPRLLPKKSRFIWRLFTKCSCLSGDSKIASPG